MKSLGEVTLDKFVPRLTEEARNIKFERWKMAVSRSLGWIMSAADKASTDPKVSDSTHRLYASIPGAVFAFSTFAILKLATVLSELNSDAGACVI